MRLARIVAIVLVIGLGLVVAQQFQHVATVTGTGSHQSSPPYVALLIGLGAAAILFVVLRSRGR